MTDVVIKRGNLATETDLHGGKRHRKKIVIYTSRRETWNRSFPSEESILLTP